LHITSCGPVSDVTVALSLSQGPVSSSDITTREKLTRPVIRMYHRHPGNELPEASELGKVWEK